MKWFVVLSLVCWAFTFVKPLQRILVVLIATPLNWKDGLLAKEDKWWREEIRYIRKGLV